MPKHITANPLETGNDELEHYALEECYKRQRTNHRASVPVIPSDSCEMAIEFARCGTDVVARDSASRRQHVERRVLTSGFRNLIECVPYEPDAPLEKLAGQPFHIVVARRGLCDLRYAEAGKVVRQLLPKLRIGDNLCVSILGLHWELGNADSDRQVGQRHAPLAPALTKSYGIDGAVCPYGERNLFILLLKAGASILRTMTATHGNVKGTAVHV